MAKQFLIMIIMCCGDFLWARPMDQSCADVITPTSQEPSELKLFQLANGRKIAYQDQIPENWNGKDVQVMFAGLDRSSRFWNPHVPTILQAGRRVIRIDSFNTGSSLKVNGLLNNITPHDDADAVVELLAALTTPKQLLYLSGHSRGAAVALEVASRLDPRLIARVDVANPLVRYLPDVFRDNNADLLYEGAKIMSLWNPWSYNPFTAGMVEAGNRVWSETTAAIGMDMAMRSLSPRMQVRKFLAKRSSDEAATGVPLETEVAGVESLLGSLQGYSVLPAARLLHQRRVAVRLLTATNEEMLVPRRAIEELKQALNLAEADHISFSGDHYAPVNWVSKYLDWILKN